ncbi:MULTISPECIES: pca operon transcription factor PcaQ [unclassified Chelatococcus]|uniref:pca operon transcription factor PcaQ n=1 Tax=unclassified Chelatococcus TaxID=2638111 RepID=UPI001BCDBDE4|nr:MULTISPECIES: pca operon transcription factor PcaQ [unclassified Chelatococcus]MBS7699795.1 pca operon transcription factor PcaQ [Chelatococcus sp. YT9]MBX3558141.1 pca operon transcription factor PcaQ [Chelatococcus sp.]
MSRPAIDPRIKLRHISCFLEVARLSSVVKAANVLNISQPAASKTIQELEDLVGAALFDRSRRNLALTPFGEVFYRYAGTSLTALRHGIEAARQSNAVTTVKIGALPTVSARILPTAVEAFSSQGPGMRVHIITGPNGYLLSLLRTGDVDLVIGRMAEPDAMLGFAFEHLYSERVVMVVRPGHPLLREARFHLAMIENYQTLMPTPESVIRPFVDRMLVANGITDLKANVETVSNAFGRAYTRQTDAIWIISEGVVANDIAEQLLVPLPIDTRETTGPVGLTTRTDTALSLSALTFMKAVRDVAASLRD